MIAVIQRCSQGKVAVSDKVVGKISHGLVILLGVQKNDTENDAEFLAREIASVQLALSNVVTADELREQIDRLSDQIAKLNKN